MLDIEYMINSNDFTCLINSTQEERVSIGGNKHIYTQLLSYIHFSNIQNIIKVSFENEPSILEHMDRYLANYDEQQQKKELQRLEEHRSTECLSKLL